MCTRVFPKEQETLCWRCQNCTRCSWADGIPVKGWEATPTIVHGSGGDFSSYLVSKCPLFKEDVKREITVNEIAAICGCSNATIFRILRGERGGTRLRAKLKGKGYKLHIGIVPTKSGYKREYFIEKINKGGDK